MTAPQWFSGPPPAVGWWPASTHGTLGYYRWWNGASWSWIAIASDSKADAGRIAKRLDSEKRIIWRHWSIDIDGTDGRGAHE
jgi:hypothetical protein